MPAVLVRPVRLVERFPVVRAALDRSDRLPLAGDGFTPVLDYVVPSRERLQEYLSHLEGLLVRLVTLDPGVEAAVQRDRERPDKTVATFPSLAAPALMMVAT